MLLGTKLKEYTDIINSELNTVLKANEFSEKVLMDAINYSIFSGGKRIRPALMLATSELLNIEFIDIMPYACAIEMIHTYSLIHDDLPAMDDDDFRRGKPTCHKKFNEAIAILAGDALLNTAIEIMLKISLKKENIKNYVKASQYLMNSAGINGMIGGQVIDMQSEGQEVSKEILSKMHNKKTGALLKAAILIPCILNNCPKEEYNALEVYSEAIGKAFQIKDDILDVVGNEALLGKPIGSDAKNSKSTYVTLFGLDRANKLLQVEINKAITSIKYFNNSEFLRELAIYIMEREI